MLMGMDYAPTFIDLFAGCGGMALGMRDAGMRPVFAVEIDSAAAQTYRANIHDHIHEGDIASVIDVPQADIVVGGPPCQGFSMLGSRDESDPRNQLWREYVRVLKSSGARAFIMENVPQLLKSKEAPVLFAELEQLGFHVSARVLNAADYGVAQNRKRAFIVGVKDTPFQWPDPTHASNPVTVRSALAGLSEQATGDNWHCWNSKLHADTLTCIAHVPHNGGDRFQMQRSLRSIGLEHLVPACWRNHQTGAKDVFGRLFWDRPSVTIRTDPRASKGRYLHPTADRSITPREAARLQSFPDDFRFDEAFSPRTVLKQIGNAVPPLLAQRLGEVLVSQLDQMTAPAQMHAQTTS